MSENKFDFHIVAILITFGIIIFVEKILNAQVSAAWSLIVYSNVIYAYEAIIFFSKKKDFINGIANLLYVITFTIFFISEILVSVKMLEYHGLVYLILTLIAVASCILSFILQIKFKESSKK